MHLPPAPRKAVLCLVRGWLISFAFLILATQIAVAKIQNPSASPGSQAVCAGHPASTVFSVEQSDDEYSYYSHSPGEVAWIIYDAPSVTGDPPDVSGGGFGATFQFDHIYPKPDVYQMVGVAQEIYGFAYGGIVFPGGGPLYANATVYSVLAEIGAVTRGNAGPFFPPSAPLNGAGYCNIKITPSLAGSSHALALTVMSTVDGGATIPAGSIQESSSVLVQGTEQSTGSTLVVLGDLGGTKFCSGSPPFAVCAHPQSMGFANAAVIPPPEGNVNLGIRVYPTWQSDSGDPVHITSGICHITEVVQASLAATANPPFIPFTASTQGFDWNASTSTPGRSASTDEHSVVKHKGLAVASSTSGNKVDEQVYVFACQRCGAVGAVPSGGFKITFAYTSAGPTGGSLTVTKSGAPITIGNFSTGAGVSSFTSGAITVTTP